MQILFIHPDRKLIGIYQKHLSPHFAVDSAHDGLSGLRKIKLHRPRMIVSEHQLPHLSGMALLQYVRRHPEMFATPFVFLSNSPMDEEALGLGATAWLRQKDNGPQELLFHLFQHLNS